MNFSRTHSDKPLRIMIIDDTPGGSGQTIHSSVWSAAITAAMLRNDTMHGVTISFEFSGSVDGPSAGGVSCLAILSAMDGLPLPADFAMTGTILPDGTIGVVGGVPEKMRAAAKAGIKRIFIPAFLRIVKNGKGEDIDLNRLAEELKIELHRVENIEEAYAILHGKPYRVAGYVNIRDMTKLPRKIEDILLPTYKDLFRRVSEKLKAHPELARRHITTGYEFSPLLAQSYYHEGKLLTATLQIFRSWQTWQAWEKSEASLEIFYKQKNPDWSAIKYLKEYHFRKLLTAFGKTVDSYVRTQFETHRKQKREYIIKNYPNGENLRGYFPFADGLSEITAQLEPIDFKPKLHGEIRALIMNRPDAETIGVSSIKELEGFWLNDVSILQLLYLATANGDAFSDFLGRLGKALPPLRANKRAPEVERLFYAAACASDFVAGQNFTSTLRADADRGTKRTFKSETMRNPLLGYMIAMHDYAQQCHAMLQPGAPEAPTYISYHTQASLKAQVYSFALSSVVLVMYGADSSSDFIPHLLHNARNTAIRNINDCVKAGIPCLPAICDFELAETVSYGNKGNYSTLALYWRASLYAKALLMSFKQEK